MVFEEGEDVGADDHKFIHLKFCGGLANEADAAVVFIDGCHGEAATGDEFVGDVACAAEEV